MSITKKELVKLLKIAIEDYTQRAEHDIDGISAWYRGVAAGISYAKKLVERLDG